MLEKEKSKSLRNDQIANDEQLKFRQSQKSEMASHSMHIKSLMKSCFSNNNNFEFYENLHKKYFDKAKEKSIGQV